MKAQRESGREEDLRLDRTILWNDRSTRTRTAAYGSTKPPKKRSKTSPTSSSGTGTARLKGCSSRRKMRERVRVWCRRRFFNNHRLIHFFLFLSLSRMRVLLKLSEPLLLVRCARVCVFVSPWKKAFAFFSMMKFFFFFFFECFVSKRRESVGFQLDLLSLRICSFLRLWNNENERRTSRGGKGEYAHCVFIYTRPKSSSLYSYECCFSCWQQNNFSFLLWLIDWK